MSPDVVGYEIGRARRLCAAAGLELAQVRRIGPSDRRCEGRREIVIRQRIDHSGATELTVSRVWMAPEHRER